MKPFYPNQRGLSIFDAAVHTAISHAKTYPSIRYSWQLYVDRVDGDFHVLGPDVKIPPARLHRYRCLGVVVRQETPGLQPKPTGIAVHRRQYFLGPPPNE